MYYLYALCWIDLFTILFMNQVQFCIWPAGGGVNVREGDKNMTAKIIDKKVEKARLILKQTYRKPDRPYILDCSSSKVLSSKEQVVLVKQSMINLQDLKFPLAWRWANIMIHYTWFHILCWKIRQILV